MINRDDAWQTAIGLMWYIANRRPLEIAQALFGRRQERDPYLAEWVDRIATRNFGLIFARLDYAHQRKFIDLALGAYEKELGEALERARDRYDKGTCSVCRGEQPTGYHEHPCE